MSRWIAVPVLWLAVSLVFAQPATVSPVTITGLVQKTAERGKHVTITGTGFTGDMQVVLKPVGATEPTGDPIAPLEVGANGTSATFVVPQESFGLYFVGITTAESTVTYGGLANALRIVSATPQINSIFRDPAYPEDDAYRIRLLGTGFSDVADDNALIIDGQRLARCDTEKPCALVTKASPRELVFTIKDEGAFHGRQKVPVSVVIDDKESNKVEIRLSRVWSSVPLWTALFGAFAIGGLLVYLSAVLKTDPAAPRTRRWDMFFIDPQTNTYSLSKLQFYLWTFATVFGYLYLASARGLVQGVLDFNDIPDGLPAVFGISAATSALAIGVTNVRGSKGSGDMGPSRADFLTTGGVVAADRVQFLVWTVVGFVTFLVLVVLRDPGTIADLPAVPQGFLLLMGVSSAGYLGGKLARKPGPNITDIKVTPTAGAAGGPATLKLDVTGDHIARNARLLIEGEDLGTADYAAGVAPSFKGGADPDFVTEVSVTLTDEKTGTRRWPAAPYKLTIVNPDGQRAVKEFTTT